MIGQEVNLHRDFPSSQNHPESIQVTRNPVRDAFHRFMRVLLRSGTWGSHISYEPANFLSANDEKIAYSGWRGGCLAACTIAGTVLFLNLIFSIYAAATSKSGMKIGSLYEGDCECFPTHKYICLRRTEPVSRALSRLFLSLETLTNLYTNASDRRHGGTCRFCFAYCN
jgi:hypothetical protein